MQIFFRSTARVLRVAKVHSKVNGLPLQAAQNEVAFIFGYADLHDLQQTSASALQDPSPDDEDLSPEELYQRRSFQTDRLVQYRRAPGREPLDAVAARATVDRLCASARTRVNGTDGPGRFPRDESIYGIVIRAETARAELARQSQLLTRADPDRIVRLSVSPHNVTERSDWPEVELLFTSVAAHLDVLQVNERDIDRIATEIGVLA